MNLTPSSLRHRLVLGAAGVGLLFAVVFGVVATWRVNHAADQAVQAALQSRLELARDEVARDGSIRQDAGSPQTDLVQVLRPDGTVRASTPALAGVGPLADIASVTAPNTAVQHAAGPATPRHRPRRTRRPRPYDRQRRSPPGTGALVVAVDAEGFNSAATHLLGLLIAGLGAVVLAMTALAWILTGRALSTVARITEDAEAVRPQDLASGLPVPAPRHRARTTRRRAEPDAGRLHHSHTTELAFAADAGHRLRTPVATLRAEAELALRETDPARADRRPQARRRRRRPAHLHRRPDAGPKPRPRAPPRTSTRRPRPEQPTLAASGRARPGDTRRSHRRAHPSPKPGPSS